MVVYTFDSNCILESVSPSGQMPNIDLKISNKQHIFKSAARTHCCPEQTSNSN